ncbi:SH3 domain-containing protein [Oceanobacillus kimchii]|uniref:SH3 domain-containing protein n=1 Tax=Oceanobacillus kimchii TaxID=746691 RepID=UPI000985B2D2|nr:SH3 domain-containing protein [Oceanobacillus kimchii]
MKKTKKYVVIFILTFLILPFETIGVLAQEEMFTREDSKYPIEANIIISDKDDISTVPLYSNYDSDEIILELENNTPISIIDEINEFLRIKVIDLSKDNNKLIEGYINKEHFGYIEQEDTLSVEDQHQAQDDQPYESEQDSKSIKDENAEGEQEIKESNRIEEKNDIEFDDNSVEEQDDLQNNNKNNQQEEEQLSFSVNTQSDQLIEGIALKKPTNVYESNSSSTKVLKSYDQGHLLKYRSFTSEWYITTVYIGGKPQTGYIHVNDVENAPEEQKPLEGIGLKNPTNVYQKASSDSKVLKSYDQGHLLKYRSFTSEWYITTVYIGGKPQTGYIHVNDVENAPEEQKPLEGIGLKNPTNVYQKASSDSKVLKSYDQGHLLKYRSFTSEWYITTVYIGGKPQTGYIYVNDVENAPEEQKPLEGIGLKNPTNVYQKASSDSKVLKSYDQGHLLKYRSFTSEWYITTVYIEGKPQTGYIHVNDVENAPEEQKPLEGIGLKNPTNVYQKASSDSRVLKSYDQGHLLKYRSFTSEWYITTVYIEGKPQTGYIHVNDVENALEEQTSLHGFAVKDITNIYSKASKNSTVLKNYSKGSVLLYKTFSSNWYQATVWINGSQVTGYLYKDDVLTIDPNNQIDLSVIGIKNPTNFYSSTSTDSNLLKSYSEGSLLQVSTYSRDWFQAKVYVNGNIHTSYVRTDDVELIDSYQENINGYASEDPTNVYSRASKNSSVIKSYKFGSKLRLKTFSNNWYQGTVYVNGEATTGYFHKSDVNLGAPPKITSVTTNYNYSFKHMVDTQMNGTPKSDGQGLIDATRGEVEFYTNPNNFNESTHHYYQFLVLSNSAGLNVNEINEKVLNSDAGSLEGQAQAFINAGNLYNINEAYLIAHALHETGRGKSTLALGIPVDSKGKVTRNSKGDIAETSSTKHIVYNMYGYGAIDGCAIECGAKYAFDRQWFSPEESIIGGAELIQTYINRGQDTLYKMRWNPISPGYPQYATHVQWATAQTSRIHSIYQLLDNYTIKFDVPSFNNLPSYGEDIKGTVSTTGSSLNVRATPSTSSLVLATLRNGATISVIGSDPSGWYQINASGITGWVSAKYINLNY